MMQFRASSVGKLMAYPDKNTLPDGAISYINEIASQIILNWQPELDTFAIEKGKQCENESISLLNSFLGKDYTKNSNRITTDLLTGEWDIEDESESLIIDIKSAYSKKTFPIAIKDGDRKLYEWQLTAYMHLRNLDNARLAYCLVDTPEPLISKKDNEDWHKVSHIPERYRVTTFDMERNKEKEEQLIARCKLAQKRLLEILDSRGYDWGVVGMEEQNSDVLDFTI
jgi:hypothetical protein